jgi:integrase
MQHLSQLFSWYASLKGHKPRLPILDFDFMLYLVSKGQSEVSCSTLDQIVSAVNWVHNFANFPSPTTKSFTGLVLRGLKRSLAKPTSRKKPITSLHLQKIYQLYGHGQADYRDLRICLFFIIGFAGFLRCSELCGIRMCDVKVAADRSFMNVHLPNSKCDQLRQGRDVIVSATGTEMCPVKTLFRFLAFRKNWTNDSFLFTPLHYNKSTKSFSAQKGGISYSAARNMVKKSILAIGEDPNLFGTHSLRSGGATAAAAAGVSDRLLQAHGRWSSSVSKDMYIVDPLVKRLDVTKSIL